MRLANVLAGITRVESSLESLEVGGISIDSRRTRPRRCTEEGVAVFTFPANGDEKVAGAGPAGIDGDPADLE